ncbi:MAG: hypothetical protein KGO22_02155 [Gammaproteobacteria bacterium]|nr:hypothetical protein [Gammaproteobacteria bacterium]
MITLTFRALNGESLMLVRGAYFRICADGTLRGPDNAVAASYTNGLWQLGRRRHRTLECREAVYIRVTTSDGQRECIGPYEYLKVAGGIDIYENGSGGVLWSNQNGPGVLFPGTGPPAHGHTQNICGNGRVLPVTESAVDVFEQEQWQAAAGGLTEIRD